MTENLKAKDPVIVALDLATLDAAERIVDLLDDTVTTYKIGHQLMTATGPEAIRRLKARGKKVFLDIKLHEIPNSVAAAVVSAASLGVDMVSIHSSGGRHMMRAAVQASEGSNLQILALTVVTGMDAADLADIGVNDIVPTQVLRLARLAQEAGVHGIIASPQEVSLLRRELATDIRVVTPGVRLPYSGHQDQVRAGSPGQAIADGANQVIVGRPIVAADDPQAALAQVMQNINQNTNKEGSSE